MNDVVKQFVYVFVFVFVYVLVLVFLLVKSTCIFVFWFTKYVDDVPKLFLLRLARPTLRTLQENLYERKASTILFYLTVSKKL